MSWGRAGKIHFDDLPMHAGGDLIGNGLVPVMPDQEVRHRDGEIRNNPPASVKIVSINDRVNHVSAQFNSAVRSQQFRHNPTPFAVFNRRTFLEQHLNSYRATPIAKRLCVTAQDLDRLSHVADNIIHSVYGVSPDCLFDIQRSASQRRHSTPALLPSPTEKRDPRAAAVQVPPFGDCCGATRLVCSKASRARKLFPIRSAAEAFRHAD